MDRVKKESNLGILAPAKEAIKAPNLAWPTIVLAVSVIFSWSWVSWNTFFNDFSLGLACLLNTVLAYVSFTPQHDAVHGSISRKYPRLNNWIGRMAGLPLFSPFYAFQRLHLAHHKHTNDPKNDPDFWSGRGPWYVLPFRWLTQELYYWYISFTRIRETSKRKEKEVIFTIVLFYGIALGVACTGYFNAVLWAWIVPSRLASGLLAFLFDYLPHRPHKTRLSDDPFQATRNIEGRGLSLLFLAQNYHLVHHVFPTVPFYRYLRLWRRHWMWFRERGGKSESLLSVLRKD